MSNAGPDELQLEYEFTLEDWVSYNEHYMAQSPSVRRMRRAWHLVPAVVMVLSAILYARDQETASAVVYGVMVGVLVIIWICIAPSLWRRSLVGRTRRLMGEGENRGLFGAKRLLMTPDRLHVAGELRESIYQWRAIERIDTSDAHVFILVGGAAAIVIPMAAFDSGAARDEFVERARAYQAQACAPSS